MGKPNLFGRFFGFKKSYFGSNAAGHDVKAYGDTSGKYMEWDASANKLSVNGTFVYNGIDRKIVKVALGAADTGGGVLAWVNPEESSIIITRLIVDVTTKSTAACTLDFGTTATNATTSSANLIDGLDSGTAAGTFDNISDAGTDGKSRQKLAPGKWVTGSKASGAAAGTKGFAYIEYIIE